jgi:hypothetical protein
VLEDYHRTVVLVTDVKSAEVWELFQGEIERLEKVEDRAP